LRSSCAGGSARLDRFVDPFVSGVFAGDPEQMSLSSCFPRLHELEQDHGGLIRGMIATMRAARAARRAGDRQADPSMRAAPSGGLLSLAEGIGELTAALRDSLLEAPETGAPVGSVERRGSAWRVSREDGTALSAEKVVIAAPAYRAAPMLRASDSALAAELDAIPHNAVAVVALGWHEEDVPRPLDGYGFLVPFKEGRSILGSLWESTVFPGRAPAGCVLTRTMVGGTRRPELVAQSEEALVRAVRAELADILGVRAEPLMARVVRHQRAIPQYHRGHRDRLERIASRLAVHPGLYLAGNAYRGVSISDCVVQARRIALAVLD
jgi:oxygen-dependent protoporphyrinogen oxidase